MKKSKLLFGVILTVGILFSGFQGIQLYQKLSIKHELSGRSIPSPFYIDTAQPDTPEAYIAHGGGIDEFHYLNSEGGVLDALQKGLTFIELDLRISSDGHIVAVHDWKELKQFAKMDDISGEPLSISQCKNLRINNKYHILTADAICGIMQKHKNLTLVTDKIRDFSLLLKEIPFPDRMIIEIFHLDEYRKALQAGIPFPAFQVSTISELNTAKELRMPIITLNASKLLSKSNAWKEVHALHKAGVTILAYSVADSKQQLDNFVKKHLGNTVGKVYTDFLPQVLSHKQSPNYFQ